MSYRSLLELNHDMLPRQTGNPAEDGCQAAVLGQAVIDYARAGDAKELPDCIAFKGMRHHSKASVIPPGVTQGDAAVHGYFGLSYADCLTVPRSILQSMPADWQRNFVALLNELDETCRKHGIETPDTRVRAVHAKNAPALNALLDYQRGRRNVFKEAQERKAGADE